MIYKTSGSGQTFDIGHINAIINKATFKEFIPPNTFVYEFGDTRYEFTDVEKIVGATDIANAVTITNNTINQLNISISETENITLAVGESTTISKDELIFIETNDPAIAETLTTTVTSTEVPAAEIVLELTSFYGQGGQLIVPNTYDLPEGLASVTFTEDFKAIPSVFMLMGPSGENAANVRYKNISISGFDAVIVEPPNYDGQHIGNTLPYYAILPGVHQVGDITIEVGYIDTQKVQGNFVNNGNVIGWERVTLENSFTNLGVIASIQTMNSEKNTIPNTYSSPWMTPTVKINDDSSFDITLDMSETAEGIVDVPERISYMAFSCGQSTTFTDSTGTTIKAETKKVNNVVGYDDGGTIIPFSNSYASPPLTIATLNSRKATEGGWLRYSDPTTTDITLLIDHDSTQNIERNHTAEDVAMFTISGGFNLKII